MLVAVAWLWWYAGQVFDSWPWSGGRWLPVVAALVCCPMLPIAVGAVRALADWMTSDNALELRLTRMAPVPAVAGALLRPALAGVRTGLCVIPLYLVLGLLPGPSAPPPPLRGVLVLIIILGLFALHLSAAAGVAFERSRQASIDDWTDFIFNVRTLAAMFLNPGALFVAVLVLLRVGYDQAGHLAGLRVWFAWPLPPALILVPLGFWSWRQLAGLGAELYGETPRLAWQVVAGEVLAFAGLAVLQVGFGWAPDFAHNGLVTWWELLPTHASGAQLLLALLLLAGYPLVLFAAYAMALQIGLRSPRHEGDQPLPTPLRALASLLVATVGAAAVPWLVYAICLKLGGWSLSTAGLPFLQRALQLQLSAALGTCGLLSLLVITPRLSRGLRELAALAVILPPLAGPFIPAAAGKLAHVLSAWSPLTALLWLLPDAQTGVGMTGEIPIVAGWSSAVVGQLILAVAGAALLAWFLTSPPKTQPERAVTKRRQASELHPLWSMEVLMLRRRGWLLTPLAMVLMPALALGYIKLHSALEALVVDTCWLFVRARSPGITGRPPGESILLLVLATIGAQLWLHPAALAGVRSFGRDQASGRTESWWLTSISTRSIVMGRYLGVCSPFLVFLAVIAPPLLAMGVWMGLGPLAVAGLAHWLGLIVMMPAVVLAQTTGSEWKGQGMPVVMATELGRLWLYGQLRLVTDANVAMLGSCLAWTVAAWLLTVWALRLCRRRLAADRTGDAA